MKPSLIRRLLAAMCVFTVLSIGCRDGGVTGPDRIPAGSGRLSVVAMFELNTATNLVIEVTAPDIPQALVFNLDIVNGTATGSVTIPAGANRQITVRAFDGRTETHRGTRTVTIVEGVNPPLSLSLLPLAGTVPVTVSFGVAVVNVTPLLWSLPVDSSVVFAATVMDATGAMQPNPIVRWASTDTRRLTIDSLGRATARDTGSVMVVAVSSGAAGRATVTVTPAVGVTPPSFTRTWVGGNGSGASQTSWVNPNNWSPAAVPTASDSVVIGAAAFQPALPTVDTLQVRDLTLLPGANLTLNFRTLTVVGGSLAGLGGNVNGSTGGTLRMVGNARLRGVINAGVLVQGGGTVTLADSARVSTLSVNGTSSVFSLAGRKLVVTAGGVAVNITSGGVLRMNDAADTLDVAGDVYLQTSAASHVGNLIAGTMIVRGNIADGNRYDASGTHRTVFAGSVATVAAQAASGFDALTRPSNMLQDVVVQGTSALNVCSTRLRVRGTLTVTSATTLGTCTSHTVVVDGPITMPVGSTLDFHGLVLGDVTGTSGITGTLSVEILTFAVANPQLRVGLAYRGVTFQRSAAISDSIRTTGVVTVDGAGSNLDVATPAGRAPTFGALTVSNGAALTMSDVRDSLIVQGALTATNSADLSQTLTAGTLRLGGSLTGQTFGAAGTHLTVLDGASATTWQDIGGMDASTRLNNVFRNLTIAHSGIGVRNCFSTVRVTGALRVVGTSTYSTCTSNFTRVDSLLATAVGTTVNAHGMTLANANGTQDVLGTWTPTFTDFMLSNQPVRVGLGYQNLRFFASNTLPAGLSAGVSLLVDGTTTVLTTSDGRATVAGLTTQTGARFFMNAGDTLRVTGAVVLNGGQSAPTGGVLEIASSFNGTGYSPTGTHELRLVGAGVHSLSGFSDRPLPTLRIASGAATVSFMNLIVQDSLILAAGTSMNTASTNFVTARGRFETAPGSTVTPHGFVLDGTATLQSVNGGFAPTVLRVAGAGTGPGTSLRNAPGIQYTNVEFYTSYALSDSLVMSGDVYASGAGVVLDLNGRKLRAPGGINFDANASARMVNPADSLIVGNGANATQSLFWDSGTSGTVSAGTIMVFGGSVALTNFVATGTNRVVFTDTSFAVAARTTNMGGNGTFRRLSIRGQSQYMVQLNSATITVTDSLVIESGRLGLNFGTVTVDGGGQGVLAMGASAVLNSVGGGVINLHSATGTSLVDAGATFNPALTRFYAANPVVNPTLAYRNVEFYGPVTFSGDMNIAGYLFAQNSGAGVALGGHRINVADYVDMGTNAYLVMTSPADTLDVAQGLSVDGGVASTMTDGVVLFRGDNMTGTNYNAVAPHRTVFLGSAGSPQTVNGNTSFGRLEVAGTRGFSANGSTYTVADSLIVSTAVPLVGSGTLVVNGPLVAAAPISVSVANLRLRHSSGTGNLQPGTTFPSGRVFLSQVSGLPITLRPNLTYFALSIESPVTLTGPVNVAADLDVGNGTNPRLTLAGNTITIGGQVDVLNGGAVFMTDAADLLRTTGTAYTYFQSTAGSGSLIAGTMEISGDFFYPYSVSHQMSGSHRVVMLRNDSRTQVIQQNGGVAIANLEIAGTGARTISFNAPQTINGSMTVTSPAVLTITQSGGSLLDVFGNVSSPATTTWNLPGTLRVHAAAGISNMLGNVTVNGLAIDGVGLNQLIPTDARYTISGALTIADSASATVASGTRRIGSGTTGSLTVNGLLSIPDGSTLQACSSSNGGFAGRGTIWNLGSGLGGLLLRMPGPLTSTTFGAGGTPGVLTNITAQFNQTTGC